MSTMKQLAEHLHLSRCTVSNILNNKLDKYKYRDETINRVRDAALKLGYVANSIAKSLRTGTTKTISVIAADFTNQFFINLLRHLEERSFRSGYNLIICASQENLEKENALLRMLQSKMVDGVIISPVSRNYSLTGEYAFPIVCVDRRIKKSAFPYVIIENRKATDRAIETIIQKGSREILFLGGSQDDSSIQARHQGYKDALTRNDLPLKEELIVFNTFTNADAYSAVARLTRNSHIQFDSLFVTSNYFLYGAIKEIREKRITLKNIVGFDELPGSEFNTMKMTKVIQPEFEMAGAAFSILIDLINKKEVQNQIFSAKIIEVL